jgi:RNA polymerase sigma-70 factor (ECF subfamily)
MPDSIDEPSASPLPDELASHRDYLYRFALAQLRDANHADDAVQETLLAAVERASSFHGRARLRTWLTGILKHKIVDIFRQQTRHGAADERDVEATLSDEEFGDAYFDREDADHWRSFPQTWSSPEQSLEQTRFWEAFDACTKALPGQSARVFMMREFMGLETDEICKELGITANNCWVLLYRARMSLRQCLEMKWFEGSR